MVDGEKDRFGDKIRQKEKGHEDDYFARREREVIEKLREARRREAVAKATGSMQCPRCGTALAPQAQLDVTVDECPGCGGVWLDKGEMEHIGRREEEGWLGQFIRDRLSKK
jgi:hypothetical protein